MVDISKQFLNLIKAVNNSFSNGLFFVKHCENEIQKVMSVILVLGGYAEAIRVGGYVRAMQVRKEATNGPTSTKELRVGKKGRKRNKFLVVELKELAEEKNKANLDAEIHLSSPQVEDTIRLTSLKARDSKFVEKDFKLPTVFSMSKDNLLPISKKDPSASYSTLWKDNEFQKFVEYVLGPSQPCQFNFNASFLWQSLRSSTLRALNIFVEMPDGAELISSRSKTLNNLLLLLIDEP